MQKSPALTNKLAINYRTHCHNSIANNYIHYAHLTVIANFVGVFEKMEFESVRTYKGNETVFRQHISVPVVAYAKAIYRYELWPWFQINNSPLFICQTTLSLSSGAWSEILPQTRCGQH
jgi:hypothetical protein